MERAIYYKCNRCGEVFNEMEAFDPNLDEIRCTECGSDDVSEAEQCYECGEWISTDDERLYGLNGLCKECLGKHASEIRTVIQYGSEDEYNGEVKINAMWAKVYTPDEINEILMADFMKLPEAKQRSLAWEYVNDDPDAFADWIAEGGADA
jgi:DNA-directed RNA polymerase subunit RPC12/RpoP